MRICAICNAVFNNAILLEQHLCTHNISPVDYYRLYISKDKNCHLCKVCNKPLDTAGRRFSFTRGFRRNVHRKCTNTEKYYILKYGETIGKIKWQEYKNKQAKTNTFEYKCEKYGWTKEQFDNYNKSRAVTLDNLIKKHGTEIGTKMFNEYCEKQKNNGCSLDWFVSKYGHIEGKKKYKELNSKKALTLNNFKIKYGEEKGTIKYNEYIKHAPTFNSKIANDFFDKLTECIGKTENVFYKNNEYGKWNKYSDSYIKFDYTDVDKKKIIEFNGDFFHPKEENDLNWKNKYISSKDAWIKDRQKEQIAIDNGFKIMYIWEHEVINDYDTALNKCLKFME